MPYAIAFVFIFLADQLSKKHIEHNMELGEKKEIIKDKLYFLHLRNSGAAYGLFAEKQKLLAFLTGISSINILNRFRLLLKNSKNNKGYKIALACITGGAAGNITDRIRKKYVTDFIYIPVGKNPPVFNIADIFVFIGVFIYLIKQLCSNE